MSNKDQQRIVKLQSQVRLARGALIRISDGCRNPEVVASETLDQMWSLDEKQPLQGVVGHERRRT